MGIVGEKPESGMRLTLERAHAGKAPWTYRGQVAFADATHSVVATITSDGSVTVELEAPALASSERQDLAEKIRLALRTAYRHAKDMDPEAPPPRRIVRWRGEK